MTWKPRRRTQARTHSRGQNETGVGTHPLHKSASSLRTLSTIRKRGDSRSRLWPRRSRPGTFLFRSGGHSCRENKRPVPWPHITDWGIQAGTFRRSQVGTRNIHNVGNTNQKHSRLANTSRSRAGNTNRSRVGNTTFRPDRAIQARKIPLGFGQGTQAMCELFIVEHPRKLSDPTQAFGPTVSTLGSVRHARSIGTFRPDCDIQIQPRCSVQVGA